MLQGSDGFNKIQCQVHIKMYRKALEVDPAFENSRRMLERLTAGDGADGG